MEIKAFLKTYGYPVMREAALFISDFLVKNPNTGLLVTAPSVSPENRFFTPEGKEIAVTVGSAMDLQIVRHLLVSVIAASEVLQIDKKFRI